MAEWWEEAEKVQPESADSGANWWEEGEIVPNPAPDNKQPPKPDETPWYEELRDDAINSYLGRGEAALTMLTGAAAQPLSGLYGMGVAAVEGPEAGAEAVREAQSALTYEPRLEEGREALEAVGSVVEPIGRAVGAVESAAGETTLEATGSPMLAAAAHTVPTLLMEALGLAAFRRPSQAARVSRKATNDRLSVSDLVDELEPEARTIEDITADIMKKKTGRLAEDVRPDLDVKKRAEELGIELNPSHYSTNEAYRRVEQAIKEQPDSKLFARESRAIEQLVKAGDELIEDLDGNLDRSLLEADLREKVTGTVKGLEDNAELAFRSVDDMIPPATKINPATSQMYINQRLAELGDDVTLLSTPERKLYRMLSRDKPPTYNALDTLRRDIGAGYKRQGPFKDTETGQLDQVYAVLIKDQHNAARGMGAGDEFAAAQKLVQTRKNIEKRAEIMFGRQMRQSFLPKLASAASTLTKGDVRQFKELMAAIPADMRQRAAATMLNDIFTLGQRNKTGIGDGFANAYGMLERNAGAKRELFKYLPEDMRRRFDSIGKISQGITRARRFENRSASGRVVMQGLQDGTIVNKIIERGGGGAANVIGWKAGGHFGAAAADRAQKAIRETFKREKAADELLASPAFTKALNLAMENKVKEADVLLQRSEAWRRWREFVGEGNRRQLAAMGPIAWLTQQEEPLVQEAEQQPSGQ